MAINKPEGTADLFGAAAAEWQSFMENAARVFEAAGYCRIEIPAFEKTELFVRGIGDSTDVVNKEMYNVLSGGNLEKIKAGEKVPSKSQFSLRPEGTAGVVRAAIENKMLEQEGQPVRLWYGGSMFRAERPQKGRMREFHQFGIECLGSEDPVLDAQAIILMLKFFEANGISVEKCTMHLNSMGCEKCRPAYRDKVAEFIHEHSAELCETCNERAEKNPLRAFDCKNEHCAEVMEGAPRITDYLCDECKAHFAKVTELLEAAGVKYELDSKLVRGLDYYTRTVFECTFDDGLGAQNAIGGGGRYDGLVQELGGKPTPGLGFAIGFERCVLAKEACGHVTRDTAGCDIFFIPLTQEARAICEKKILLSKKSCDMDFRGGEIRSLKSQMKLADKAHAKCVAILGEDELAAGSATVRNLSTHEETQVPLDEI